MGAMGRYLGALSGEQRDRLVSAPTMNTTWGCFFDDQGCGCMVAIAEGMNHFSDPHPIASAMDDCPYTRMHVEDKFAQTCERFGGSRTIRAVKLRAARLNGAAPEDIAAMLAAPTPSTAQGV